MNLPRFISTRLWLLMWIVGATAGCTAGGPAMLTGADPSAAGSEASAKSAGDEVCLSDDRAAELADQVLRLVNIERFRIGAVTSNGALSRIADDYACTMISDGYFGHVQPKTGRSIADRVGSGGYDYVVVGENLAAGIRSAAEIVDAWLESPTHRDILLDPTFTEAGVGVRLGGEYGIYCVLILAQPAS